MHIKIAVALATIGLIATSCGSGSDTEATTTADTTTEATDAAETTDTTTEATDESTTTTEATETDDGPGNGGPGGGGGGMGFEENVDAASVSTEAELMDLIAGSTACGNGALDLHRGHQPIEAKLIEVLGISHDEMHVRMEQSGQNLAAVADDLGVGAENLEAALIEHLSPAIDALLDAGTITEEQAAEYADLLAQAIEFRVYWDGVEAPLDFCTAAV